MSEEELEPRKTRQQPDREGPLRDPGGYFREEPNGYREERAYNTAYQIDRDMVRSGFDAAQALGSQAVEQGYKILEDMIGDQPDDYARWSADRGAPGQDPWNTQGMGIPLGQPFNLLMTYGRMWGDYLSLANSTAQATLQQLAAYQSAMQPSPYFQPPYSPASPVPQWTNPYDPIGNTWRMQGQNPYEMDRFYPGAEEETHWARDYETHSHEPETTEHSNQGTAYELVIDSDRPTRVHPYWRDGFIPSCSLSIQGPYARGENPSTRMDARFEYDEETDTQTLFIRIPEQLPDGDYSGVIYSELGADFGYVAITVFPREGARQDS